MKTLFIIKPDAFERELDKKIADILGKEFTIVEKRQVQFTPEKVAEFYAHLSDRPEVVKELQQFITSMPVKYFVAEGSEAITRGRELIGATNPMNAHPKSIRGKYNEGTGNLTRNLVHASDSSESFSREYAILSEL